jgi:hypothetical protein
MIVHGALMIEPTESESLEELDLFIAAMRSIAKEVEETPELVKTAPHSTRVSRSTRCRRRASPSCAGGLAALHGRRTKLSHRTPMAGDDHRLTAFDDADQLRQTVFRFRSANVHVCNYSYNLWL